MRSLPSCGIPSSPPPEIPTKVGRKSRPITGVSIRSPAGIRSGQRKAIGTLVPPSYTLDLPPRSGPFEAPVRG